ncbi:MAG TPA: hypothetical protein VGI30_09585, partial [Caulobacteraceae bacterium]
DRWRDLTTPPAPDMSRAGLVIDLARRVSPATLAGCFATVTPLGTLTRGDPGEPGKTYAVFAVGSPRRDVLANGC